MKLLLHPLPVRIFHWLMVVCISVLLFTGFYQHSPFEALNLPFRVIRKIHGMSGMMLLFILAGQLYYYGFTKKFTEMIFLPGDVHNVYSFARYILFLSDGHPNFGRYNPGQKLLFTLWGCAVLAAAFTGLLLLFPENVMWGERLLGGLNHIRIIHYFTAVIFASSVPLHLYLVFTEDPAKLQAMFTGYVDKDTGESHGSKPTDS